QDYETISASWLRDMFLDPATQRDLDILSTSTTRGPTVLDLVDRTRTRVGREHLRRRLVAPAHSADEILALQRAHQALASEALKYREILNRIDSDPVER